MLPRPGITQNLARFVVETKWEDIPDVVRHEAKRALLNFFAVAIAGCRTTPVELALKQLAEFSGGKQATLVGRNERIDALSAAFLNAAGANVFDFCDTHVRTVIHCGGGGRHHGGRQDPQSRASRRARQRSESDERQG